MTNTFQFVVVGDIHGELKLAFEGLEKIEREHGRIDQVFSVGDVGLFLEPEDWNFLAGPKKHRHPERSAEIAKTWSRWRWPLAMIGGNHEPYHRLRKFDPGYFGPKLAYTNAGLLEHTIPGLRVYGLSGIHHPEHLQFSPTRTTGRERAKSWSDMVDLARDKQIKLKELTYYKQSELDALLALPPEPQLLLLHDWPAPPSQIHASAHRPELEVVTRLRPQWVCSGHHHTIAEMPIGASQFLALNIVTHATERCPQVICKGWAATFEWRSNAMAPALK